MSSRIIISDVHGCYATLMLLMKQLPKDVPITFAGDLIDRGKNSKQVVEFVKNGGYDCVVGNHEVMMMNDLQFSHNSKGEHVLIDYYSSNWIFNGGQDCLDSYTDDSPNKIDTKTLKEHLEWFNTLPYFIEYKNLTDKKGNYLLVTHSTAAEVWDETNHESAAFRNAVTWDRIPYPSKINGIYNVYGHTPQKHGPTVRDHFACIDTGAYFKREQYGRLTALQFPEMKIYTQNNAEGKDV